MAMNYNRVELQSLFQKPFEHDAWRKIIKDYFNATDIRKTPEQLPSPSDEMKAYSLGYTITSDNYEIYFLYYKCTNKSIARRKVTLRQLAKSMASKLSTDAVLAVFDDGNNWRLSFICDLKGEKTSPKRFTYVFGDPKLYYHTPVARFLELQKRGISFANIKDAFSVEAVNKEFYTKLFSWYEWAQKDTFNVTFPNMTDSNDDDRVEINQHLIRLITRLIFVWFIKQKNLIADELFEPQEVAKLLKNFNPLAGKDDVDCKPQKEETTNYYHAIIQNLFFATLNKTMNERRFSYEGNDREKRKADYSIKSLYRYSELFINDKAQSEAVKLFDKTPFLNGGLFECLDKSDPNAINYNRVNYVDGFSRNDEMNGTNFKCRAFIPNVLFFNEDEKQPGLITLLKQYNFTVEESTANDAVVALDPELLGKIFENLLASYNPETKESARKSSGSYYTPREIVKYMVEQSIAEALKTKLPKVDPEAIDALIQDDECPKALDMRHGEVKDTLLSLKIIDPAVGSGAFPMGVMQCMLEIIQKLFPETDNIYELKKRIIEDCLYGVDIQPIAVQITKLRCFISLIVDEMPDPAKPNHGMMTLPNLETKFVAANSLIPLNTKTPAQPSLFDLMAREINAERRKLLEIRHKHFLAKTYDEKKALREADKISRTKLAQLYEKNKAISSDEVKRIIDWDPYNQNQFAPFFDPEWMLGVSEGFDIVIANPPYGATMSDTDKACYKSHYQWLKNRYDIYMVFFELGITITNNVLCFITPDKWLSKSFGLTFREKCMIPYMRSILHLGNAVFESATVDAIVTNFSKNINKELSIRICEEKQFVTVNRIDKKKLTTPYLIDQYFEKEKPEIIRIVEKQHHVLGDYAKCEYAMASPTDAYKLKEYISENSDPGISDLILINTGIIEKYTNRWKVKSMKYLKDKYNHPTVRIDDIKSIFGETFIKRMTSPKLIIKGLNLLDCCIDYDGRIMSTVATLNIRSQSKELLNVLAAIINSSVMTEYCKAKYKSSSYCGGLLFTPDMINNLPVPDLSNLSILNDVIKKVNSVFNDSENRKNIISEIDALVRKMYKL